MGDRFGGEPVTQVWPDPDDEDAPDWDWDEFWAWDEEDAAPDEE